MHFTIRKARASDALAISQLIIPLTKKYVCPDCDESVHNVLLDSMSPERIEGYMASNYSYVVAVSESNEVIGVGGVRDNTHLYHLFVHDEYQGKGLSRQLWENVKGVALQNGNKGRFTVNSALSAENVYLKFGFKRIHGVRREKGMVDIPMVLDVTEK
ncbi:GNAT family N-acetyltransferase [Vibrio mediterranei]|uniref:GNAT family N-acetyltransferase n=1 Tax=Vibrio mediterranei TaxID=689 RepID=UPI00148B866D|nr:GNAT family N-acetyltransferase [Vibrio mediterranei]NOH30745.1 GNAT family N-acetyltransferase [Vibrio mediterranei]